MVGIRETDWLPIETAPKDGTEFDVWIPSDSGGHRLTDLSFNRNGQLRQNGLLYAADLPRRPTHWMPKPAPPRADTNPKETPR